MKIFQWGGNIYQIDIMKALGYQPVPLETADILPGLQSGLINAVPSTPIYALAGQFYRQTPYMLGINWVPIAGAAVMTRKIWDTIPAEAQQTIRTSAEVAGEEMRISSRKESREAVDAMKKRGLSVQPVTQEIEAEWRRMAEEIYPQIRGKMVPADLFDEVQRLLNEYRAARGAQ